MVYESDFYTTRRYRPSPSLSTYTVSYQPSRQVRLLPGLGKVHVVHTYDRIVPYVGHKRLTVVSAPPKIFKVRPSVLLKEFDRIQYKYRPAISYSYVNNYLNSNPSVNIIYAKKPIPGLDTYTTIHRPGRLYLHTVISRPTRLYFDILGHKRHWYDVRISYLEYPYLGYNRLYSNLTNVYYHSLIERPSKLYQDILGSPRWSRYWYRFWYDIPSKYYSSYYDSSLSHPYYLTTWSPSLSWYNCWSPYYYKNLTRFDSSKNFSTYVDPNWSRYWRSAWSRYYDAFTFNDETSRIKADAAGLLKRIHTPVIRTTLPLLPYNLRYSEPLLNARVTSDDYNRIHKLFSSSPYNSKTSCTTYYAEPVKKYIGAGHLAAISYFGDKSYGRRRNIRIYEDPVKDDIQLLSYYINKFRSDKASKDAVSVAIKTSLPPNRPSRVFSQAKLIPEPEKAEEGELKVDRASIRLGLFKPSEVEVESKLKRQKEEAKLAEERAIAEEASKKKAQALKEEAARKAELARQEELAAQAASERAAELERKAEQARQEELAKQAELERIRQEEEEKKRLEAEKAEEERLQLLRLEEIARQAEEERERELARQAEELAELARQEAELEELARKEAEALAQAKREEELAELARQEAELEELERQEKELAELARQEAELAELAKQEAEIAKQEAEIADLTTQEAELSGLKEKQEAELDALAAKAKALGDDEEEGGDEEESAPAADSAEPEAEEEEEEEE